MPDSAAASLPDDAFVVSKRTPLVRRRVLFQAAPLMFAVLAATVMYFPALNSAFVTDDYTYLYAVNKLSLTQYAHVALVPGTNSGVLTLTGNFWRPLYYLSFEVTVRLFGDHVVLYHLLNLGIHVATIVLVWLLARRLTGRWEAAAIACAVFAVHPVGFETVTWISSVNSIGLPLSLAAWLAFMSAVESDSVGKRRLLFAGSTALLAVALGFRETAVMVLPAMMLWYFLIPGHGRIRDKRSWLNLLPFVVLCLAYLLLKTKLFTVPAANSHVYQFDRDTPGVVWYYLKLGLFPFADQSVTWHIWLERVGAALVLVAIPVAAPLRRWLLVALLLAFVASVVPYAPLSLGPTPRYFYFPSAFLALALGVVAVELLDAAKRRLPGPTRGYALAAAIAIVLLAGVYSGRSRVNNWIAENADVHQAWVAQLRAQFPTLPAGGTLYTTNVPLKLAVFDAAPLAPTVGYYYPQVANVVRFDPADLPQVRSHVTATDRIFIYHAPNSPAP